MEKKYATRKDIAERAGTSVSVVSRALNNSGYVEAGKKKKILQIAEELNYVPNPVAVSLQTRRTRQILFYCKNIDNVFNIQLYKGMMNEAAARGYMVLFNGKLSFEEIKNTLVDGIIMQDQEIAGIYMDTAGKNYHLPVVSASYGDRFSTSHGLPVVEIDMFGVVETALDYLWDMGHRRILMALPYTHSQARINAFRSWMKTKGLNRPDDHIISISRQNPKLQNDERLLRFREETEADRLLVSEDFYGKGVLAAQLFAEQNRNETAVLAFNDELALGMIRGFSEMGVRVPEDVSVMGIDGITARKYVSPLLTTINLFPEKQGEKCARLLLDILEGKKVKYVTHARFELEPGESVTRYQK